jgi:hypothetical protein
MLYHEIKRSCQICMCDSKSLWDSLAHRRDEIPKDSNYVNGSTAFSINSDSKHLMMTVSVDTCSVMIFLFIYCFFTIYSGYLKRVISKKDGCIYLKHVPSSMVLWSLSDEILWPHSVESSSYFRLIEKISY